MAATLTAERFDDPSWRCERKYDGIRLIAYVRDGRVRLYSRNRIERTVGALEQVLMRQPSSDFVLDGEHAGGDYFVFDAPRVDGRDVTPLPLADRLALLQERFAFEPPMRRVDALPGTGHEAYDRACREGWEGVIAKRLDSAYEQRRSKAWLKWKCEASQEFVVGGFTEGKGIGALLIGYWESGDLVFAGKVGWNIGATRRAQLRALLDPLEIDKPPFTRAVGLPRVAYWVRPEVVVQVAFTEWTGHDKLRHPRLLHVRDDKNPREVVREI